MKRSARFLPVPGVMLALLLFAGCAGESAKMPPRGSQVRLYAGATDEPSCGGTWAVFYVEAGLVIKIDSSIETSQRLIEREYYFREMNMYRFHDTRLERVVETSRFLLDGQGERLKEPRFEYQREYPRQSRDVAGAKKWRELEEDAKALRKEFAGHPGQFPEEKRGR